MFMDNEDIGRQLKILSFLKTFDDDTNKITDKLIQRYKNKPNEQADIVISTAVTICARIIWRTIPVSLWEDVLIFLKDKMIIQRDRENNKDK